MKTDIRKICAFALLSLLCAACESRTAPADAGNASLTKDGIAENRVSPVDTDAAEPNLAAAADGGVFVVWARHAANRQADIFLQKFDAGGAAISDATRVNPNAGEATAWRGDPPTVAAGADGKVFVGWTAGVESGGRKGTNLMLSISRDGGRSFAAPIKINDDDVPASHGMHSLAVGANNRVLVAWLDERNIKPPEKAAIRGSQPEFQIVKIYQTPNAPHNSNAHSAHSDTSAAPKEEAEPNSEVFYALSTDGGATFSANRKIASDVCPCCKTSAIFAPNGRVFVSWRQVLPDDFRHIAVASSADGGEKFSAPVIVADDQWQINACPVSGASLVAADGQRLAVAWFTGGAAGEPGLYFSESADGGKTFAPRRAVYDGDMVGASNLVAGESRNLQMFFEANGRLFSREIAPAASNEAKEIGAGETPVAAQSGGKIFVAFIKKENGRRSVWLIISEN